MRLIYIHIYNGNPLNGINKKIFSQASNLYKLGINIKLALLSGISNKPVNEEYIEYLGINQFYFFKLPIFYKILRQYYAKRYIKKIIRSTYSSTIVYLRYPLPLFLLPFDLSNKRRCYIVIECNSIEIIEQKKSGFGLLYIRELLLGKEFRKRCDAIVGVTDEITQYQIRRSGTSYKSHITIGNGCDVNSIPIRNYPNFQARTLNLLCVANLSYWHGLDRLVRALSIYKGITTVTIHIASEGAEVSFLNKLSKEMGVIDNVIFHGFKTGKELDHLFNVCHIAIGSLGIHRKGLTQTSELKAREYCARGIPWVIACRDPDFPDDFPYIYRIPADESPVNIEELIEFANSVYIDPEHPQKMRTYAIEHLDWSVKMKKLKTFMESLFNEPPL